MSLLSLAMCQCVIIDIVVDSPGLERLGAVCDDPGVVGVDHAGVVLLLVHVVDHVPLHPLQISHLQYCHSREMSKQFNYTSLGVPSSYFGQTMLI